MALVVFLRGVNVGGHRTFRPSVVAGSLSAFDVVNIGAAGTFVVRKPGSRARFRAALAAQLPFEAEVMICDGRDIVRLQTDHPFGNASPRHDVVRFVSVFSKAARVRAAIPLSLPDESEWLVRLVAAEGQFVFGEYRRHMKTIGYLGKVDTLFGAPATTRNWNTIQAIVRVLEEPVTSVRTGRAPAAKRGVKRSSR
jgi:uncharacterized protein (DUF1697 family)